MLRERHYVLRQIHGLADLGLVVAAFFLAHWLRATVVGPWLLPEKVVAVESWRAYGWLLFFMPPLTVLALQINGYYDTRRIRSRWEVSRCIALAVIGAAIVSFAISIMFRQQGRVSRVQTVLIPIVLYVLIELKTVLVHWILRRRRLAGRDARTLLLVGGGEPLARFVDLLQGHPYWGFQPVGVVSDSPDLKPDETVRGIPVLGVLDDALSILRSRQVDEVLVAPSEASLRDLAPLMCGCEEMGIRSHLSLVVFQHTIARPTIDLFHDVPVATYSPVQEMGPLLLVKYVFDRVGSAMFLALTSPVFLLAMAAIRLTSRRGDPVFFAQMRCGLNGKPFLCWKFRSMRVGAEGEGAELRGINEADGPVFKLRQDPRVTRVGRFLRRWSLDELPQLWNVLKGDMSLVGPRPPIPAEVEQYDMWQRRRLSMRPGLTCLWQVSGRSTLSFETWMKLDLSYIDNWSLWLDFKILARTFLAVLSGKGAM
jgi:exopolysaccharide biosynthesis polyprenyl glycosylphosphotransferase